MSRVLSRWETDPEELTIADGEAGLGVYAFFDNDAQLDSHYQEPTRRRVSFTLKPGVEIVDLRKAPHLARIAEYAREMGSQFKVTRRTLERAYWSIATYIARDRPDCAAYLVPHITHTTRSVQIVVRDPSVIILKPCHAKRKSHPSLPAPTPSPFTSPVPSCV